MTSLGSSTPREQWARCWLAAPREAFLSAARAARDGLDVRYLSLPQNGLALLPLKDGAYHETFNLGEIPLARVHLALTRRGAAGKGEEIRGGACVMEDDMECVEALALADALMAADWPQAEPFVALLADGERAIEQQTAERKALLSATTVDFSLLGMTGDDDTEDTRDA
ncbi:phosphonate C-P lyase system protein PhnG [Ectothiorhodospira mobilis]|uniref:phosphonate C-P lyase system protein PhnG n=1 Tax=Ectothiorhodospira mobilis TaxID=195064 RepID=UPI001EE9982E|nr:phosphonate C-P lyase system protein PhnG [Ectothiorhodospira mobilis]MCG5536801.1 phosphonate C-P lyase system protein PhnG [Ectothiorhodospira mobilis]